MAGISRASDAAAVEPAAGGALEEIVVTATRREESISRVPISVTAFSQEMIDQKGVKDFQDVVRFTPGVSIDTSGTNAISIRGISSSGGAGTTGIYIDDTPIQMRALGFNPDDTLPKTFDLDRVEVLRGPQGTLFGSGSEGGTVRYIMNQPSVTKESTYARAEASYTQYGQPSGEIGVAHGGPIIDDVLGFRASVWYRYDGGWIDRIDPTTLDVADRNANHSNTIAARLAFLVQPIEALKITPSFTYQNARKHDIASFWPAYSDLDNGRFIDATPERMPNPDEYYLGAVKIEANLGFATLISNTSYYHRDELTAYQGTAFDLSYFQTLQWPSNTDLGCAEGTPPCPWYPLLDGKGIHIPAGVTGYITPNTMTNRQRNWSEEIRLQSNDDGNSRFKWTVGGFWSLATELSIEELKDPQVNDLFQSLYGINATDLYGPFFNCPSDPANSTPQSLPFPDCDIYYAYNRTPRSPAGGIRRGHLPHHRPAVRDGRCSLCQPHGRPDALCERPVELRPLWDRHAGRSRIPGGRPGHLLGTRHHAQGHGLVSTRRAEPVLFHLRQGLSARRIQPAAAVILLGRPHRRRLCVRPGTLELRIRPYPELRKSDRRTASATPCASPAACTTSNGRTFSRTCTSPEAAPCSSPTIWERPSPRASICRHNSR